MKDLPGSAQRVVDAAAGHGLAIEVVEYPDGARTAIDAANAVGCEVGQIVKSLIFSIDGELVLALTSGSNRVDTKALTKAANGERCDRADADQVRAITGFAIGGVPPFGHTNAVRAFFDPALLEYELVWAAAGTPRHVFPLAPKALHEATGAQIANFAES
jgi:prolyl-tRNA editing enzyme YbaK/EbsC (Cys-tRNA(Pro) deacylase)